MSADSEINVAWAIVIIIVLPAVIVLAAELDERLRQRESPLRPAVTLLRNWGLPFLAIWSLLVPVFGVEEDNLAVRLAGSGLVLSLGAVALSVLRVAIQGIRNAERAGTRRGTPQLLLALPRIGLALLIGWLLIAGVWGVDLSAALTALGVTSLVISFALQDTLSGLASGVLLLSDQPFKTGDWISTAETEGQVTDINWRISRIRARDGSLIVVPNSELANASLINFSAPEPLQRITVSLTVAYANPPTLAKAMLLDAARATPGVLLDPPPVVHATTIDDPLMGYDVKMWMADYAIKPQVISDFGSLVWYQSHRHNVPLPSPAQDLYLWDGVATEAASHTTPDELRRRILCSPLLASLQDEAIDLLVHSASAERYAVDEVIVDSNRSDRDIVVITEGRARLAVVEDDRTSTVSEFERGDIVGIAQPDREAGHLVRVIAITDCETVSIDAEAAAQVIGGDSNVSSAYNRTLDGRMHRLERVLERRTVTLPESVDRVEDDSDASGHSAGDRSDGTS